MTEERYWQFRKLAAIEEPVFNGVLEKFYDLGIDGLVRENIQNSLDGKNVDCEEPVEVLIETGRVETDAIPGIDEIRERIQCLQGENDYTKNTIDHMRTYMNEKAVPYISFEDRNTKGLSGASRGEKYEKGDTWGVYAYKKGVHHFEEDSGWENIRGGSHGVGKIASNAASDLYLMYFANCDAQQNQHLGGTVQLIEHIYKDESYRSTGYFSNIDADGALYPFENTFSPVFRKDTRGLKIIIPFLRKQFCDEKQILRSVCDNFFVAILSGDLVVFLNKIRIDKDSIFHIVSNQEYYEEQEDGEIQNNFTPLYIRTWLGQEPCSIEIMDKKKVAHRFLFYFNTSELIKKGRVAIVRRIGMKIEDKKIRGYVNASFNGILIPASDEEDIFLKTMENESHTELSHKHIKNPEEQKNALRFINNISKRIGEMVAEMIKERNPPDGKIDTSDLLYSVENSFQKELKKNESTVKLTKGNRKSEKILVKLKTNSREKKKDEKGTDKKKPRKKVIRRVQKKDGRNDMRDRVRYLMSTESIQRLVLKDREILHLDFSGDEQYGNETTCDIAMAVVDGMGKEYETEFDLKKNYFVILDRNVRKECKVDGNIIKNVSIKAQQVYLEMKTSQHFNKSLKFIYYVEV